MEVCKATPILCQLVDVWSPNLSSIAADIAETYCDVNINHWDLAERMNLPRSSARMIKKFGFFNAMVGIVSAVVEGGCSGVNANHASEGDIRIVA